MRQTILIYGQQSYHNTIYPIIFSTTKWVFAFNLVNAGMAVGLSSGDAMQNIPSISNNKMKQDILVMGHERS